MAWGWELEVVSSGGGGGVGWGEHPVQRCFSEQEWPALSVSLARTEETVRLLPEACPPKVHIWLPSVKGGHYVEDAIHGFIDPGSRSHLELAPGNPSLS